MLKRKATAVWRGAGADGSGQLTTTSGVLQETPYSASARFQSEDGKAGTNPEELIAAAHAGCFNMALAFRLTGAGHPPEELTTEATVTIEKEGVHWTVVSSNLKLRARVPGLDQAQFEEFASGAKEGCPISKVLNAKIELDATLEG
jgi:lipoyl-dependent peroxiredoxin